MNYVINAHLRRHDTYRKLVRVPRRCPHRAGGRSRNPNDIKFVPDQAR